jgi:allantoate deiminase
MDYYQNRAEKVVQRIEDLALITEEEGCITRTFGTKPFLEGSKKVFDWMLEAGLNTRIDNIGNVRGKLLSDNPQAKTFVIGSHIDTVVNAGKFDGPLGVLMGLDLLEHIIQSNTKLPFHIELIAFSDEEGVRFHTTYLGSKVVAGSFDMTTLERKDAKGIALKEVITEMGGNHHLLDEDKIAQWLGYFEIHIEQGPVLYEKNIPVAVVTAIAGQRRAEITFTGVAGHAGTVPMDMRQDALATAAEFIVETEKYALQLKDKIVATTGKLEVIQSASNVIPGKVVCSLDLRSADVEALSAAYDSIQTVCYAAAEKRKVQVNWNLVQQTIPTLCNETLTNTLKESISKSGYPVIQLVSGAGHDGVPISAVSPITMLFVRCFEGISHNPLENAETKDIAAAIEVSDKFLNSILDFKF